MMTDRGNMFQTRQSVSAAEFAQAFVLAAFGIFKTIPKKLKCTEPITLDDIQKFFVAQIISRTNSPTFEPKFL